MEENKGRPLDVVNRRVMIPFVAYLPFLVSCVHSSSQCLADIQLTSVVKCKIHKISCVTRDNLLNAV